MAVEQLSKIDDEAATACLANRLGDVDLSSSVLHELRCSAFPQAMRAVDDVLLSGDATVWRALLEGMKLTIDIDVTAEGITRCISDPEEDVARAAAAAVGER